MEGARLSIDEVAAIDTTLEGRRYLTRAGLIGNIDPAFRALGMRPLLQVIELLRWQSYLGEDCNDKTSQE